MTNKQDEEEASSDSDPRTAALTAVHVVSEVLDEAYDIANAAQDSGQPWRYLSMLKKINNNEIGCVRDEDESFEPSKGDSVKENNEVVANIVATSTPQKNVVRQIDCADELNEFNDSTLIGQGDQGMGENDNTLTNSTSMYINKLFDMSELERVIVCDGENENNQGTSESNDLLSEQAFSKIMENYVNYLFPPIEDTPAFHSTFNPFLSSILTAENEDENVGQPHRDHSEYLFLADSSVADIGRDVGFYIEEDGSPDRDVVILESDMVQKVKAYECIGHTSTVDEVYKALRTGLFDDNYENHQTTVFDTENYKDLPTATEEDYVDEGLRSAMNDKDLQDITDNSEVELQKLVDPCSLQVSAGEEINESQITAPVKEDYKNPNTAMADMNVIESQKTTLPVEISKDIRTATIEMENYESLLTATDKNVYKGLLSAAIENVHKHYRNATVEKEIQEDLRNTTVDKENTYETRRTIEVSAVKEINDSQITAPVKVDYKTAITVMADMNVGESQKTTMPVESSKNIRTATIKMDGFESLQTAKDKNEYKGLIAAVIENVHKSYRNATAKNEIQEDLRSTTVGKENTYKSLRNVDELEQEDDDIEKEAIKQKNDFELYENAYMTLNRDYDQNSEDDGFPILQDPKEMVLQEVELMTHPSEEELRNEKTSVPKQKEEATTASGISVRSKSTLARRCRLQGARLFACIRGWWRRKTPGKRKEMRKASLGVCPLSPEGRRRSSSLLDSRHLRSPPPSRPAMWKFNTVNEALVNSNCWKEYTFDAMAGGSEQF